MRSNAARSFLLMAVVNWRQKVGQLRSANEVRAEELSDSVTQGMHNRTSVARKQDVLVIVVPSILNQVELFEIK